MSTELNPLAVSIRKCNEITLHPLNPTMHGGGGITRVIATVAAVAVPFAAPTIAASLGVSGAISAATGLTVSSTVASAITGAAMGGIAAAVGGQSITRGALMGGIGGAVGGYLQGGEPAITTTTGEAVAAGGSGLPPVPEIGLSTASPTEAVFGPAASGPALSVPGAGVSVPGALPQSAAATAAASTTTQGLGQELLSSVQSAGSKVLDKITSPDVLASATLQAVGQLTAAAMVPEAGLPGFSPEEQELVEARRQELEELKARDLDAYNQQIAISKQYLQQAGLVDPTYFAAQSANRALIASARARKQQEDEQAFDPFRTPTAGENIRTNLETARQRQTAFDKGYLEGIGLQTDYTEAARKTMPTSSPTNYYDRLAGLQGTLAYGSRMGDIQRQNVADFSSQFNLQTGRDEEDEKKLDESIRAGLAIGSPDSYLDDQLKKNTQNYIGGLAT